MNHYFKVLILAFLISLFAIIFYVLIKPDDSQPFGFTPLPDQVPGTLIPSTSGSVCNNSGVVCSADSDCSSCGKGFTCQVVDNGRNVLYNGIVLTPGNSYCLPKIDKTFFECSTYNGRAVWTEESDGGQGWKCICMYPTLFGNKPCSSVDKDAGNCDESCSFNKACKVFDPNDPTKLIFGSGDQAENRLVKVSDETIVYDPQNPPPGNLSPFSVDSSGNPEYHCACNAIGDTKFTRLPNDPYRCHVDPCQPYASVEVLEPGIGFNMTTGECDCNVPSSTSSTGSAYGLIKSNVDGFCRRDDCVTFSGKNWNIDTDKCNCDTTKDKEISFYECSSYYYDRSADTPRVCTDYASSMENTSGGVCRNPCVKNGINICDPTGIGAGTCIITSTYGVFPETTKCECNAGYNLINGACSKCMPNDTECDTDINCCSGYCGEAECEHSESGVCVRHNYKCKDKQSGCFLKGTKVLMSDYSSKNIEDVEEGDKILGYGGVINTRGNEQVTQLLGDQEIYGFNEETPFFTAGHTFMTTEGLKAIDPSLTMKENIFSNPKKLQVGDIIFKITFINIIKEPVSTIEEEKVLSYLPIVIKKITKISLPKETRTYGIYFIGSDNYHAAGYVVGAQYPRINATYIKEGLKRLNKEDKDKVIKKLIEIQPELNKVIHDGFLERII